LIELIAVSIVAVVFMALAVVAIAFHLREAEAWRKERSDLLARIMARSWGEYVSGTTALPQNPLEQLSTDEIEAAWYAKKSREAEAA